MTDDYEASMSNVDVEGEMQRAYSEASTDDARRWAWLFVIHFAGLGLAILFGIASFMVTADGPAVPLFALAGLGYLVAILTWLACFPAYYKIARHQPEGAWQPNWPLWTIGHLFVPGFAAGWFTLKLRRHRVLPI